MSKRVIGTLFVLWLISMPLAAGEPADAKRAVDTVLTTLHQAASDGAGELYFSLFAEDAIFMGTDTTERWTVEMFKAFAEPYFSRGLGWTYTKKQRSIYISSEGSTAWFDELLWNDNYGFCRGTGVLTLTDNGWKFVQYNLTIPIPNDLAGEITDRIKKYGTQPAEPSQ